MFKKGQEVTVNAMGDSKNGTVVEDTRGNSTRVHVGYNDPLSGRLKHITMNFGNNMIKLR